MKSNYKVVIGVLTGVLSGAGVNHAIQGQQLKTPPVYLISEVDSITDANAIREYGTRVNDTLAPFDGHYHFLVRGGKTASLDGGAPPKGIVVIAFDNAEQAHAWYDSPAYAAIRPIRQGASTGRMFIVGGVATQ